MLVKFYIFWIIRDCKLKKKSKDFEKNMNKKKSEIFQEISRNFSAFVEKTVLIRKIVLFLSFKKPYQLEIRTIRNRTNGGLPVFQNPKEKA